MNIIFIKDKFNLIRSELCYHIELDVIDENQNSAYMIFYLTELLNVEDPENTNRHIDVELVNIYHEIDNINTLHNMIAAGEKYIRENLDTIINTE